MICLEQDLADTTIKFSHLENLIQKRNPEDCWFKKNKPQTLLKMMTLLKMITASCCLVSQWCLTLSWPHGLSPPKYCCSWDFPARIPEWVAFSRGSSPPGEGTRASCIAGWLNLWAGREAPVSPLDERRLWKCSPSGRPKPLDGATNDDKTRAEEAAV